jgi:hypothetical protein
MVAVTFLPSFSMPNWLGKHGSLRWLADAAAGLRP